MKIVLNFEIIETSVRAFFSKRNFLLASFKYKFKTFVFLFSVNNFTTDLLYLLESVFAFTLDKSFICLKTFKLLKICTTNLKFANLNKNLT